MLGGMFLWILRIFQTEPSPSQKADIFDLYENVDDYGSSKSSDISRRMNVFYIPFPAYGLPNVDMVFQF